MFAKRFFYVSAAILCLALAYHLGARNAGAQAPGNPVVAMPSENQAVTANGDIYIAVNGPWYPFQRVGNIFSGGATSATPQTMGQLKVRYR